MLALFLDIDGVLCFGRKHACHLEKRKLKFLKKIQAKTGARIILISVWRKSDWNLKYLMPAFKKYKIEWDPADKTGSILYREGNERPFEIRDFLEKHPEITNFAVLDDENHKSFGHHMFHADLMRKPPGIIIKEGLIHKVGLTKDLAEAIITYLNRPKPEFPYG